MSFMEGSFLVRLTLSFPLALGMRMRLGCRGLVVLQGLNQVQVRFLVMHFFGRVLSTFIRTSGGVLYVLPG